MISKIQSLTNDGNIILPRTVAKAVTMEDGTNLEYAISNRSTEHVKIVGELATALGVIEGTTLSEYLSMISANTTSNTLAVAEVVTE